MGDVDFIQGYDAPYIIGIDEVGTGAWAGPFVVAACACKKDWSHPFVKDSKLFSNARGVSAHAKRKILADKILVPPEVEDTWVYVVGHEEMNEPQKMGRALARAMEWLVEAASTQYPESLVVVDGNDKQGLHEKLAPGSSLVYLPKGDNLIPVVAAASIIAKAFRDERMIVCDRLYPGYDFGSNKGYGTRRHKIGLRKQGPCEIHRLGCCVIREAGKMMQHDHPSGEERAAGSSSRRRRRVRRRREEKARKAG